MQKAISAIIATIMLLMITVSLIGVFYVFSSTLTTQTTSSGSEQVSQLTKQLSYCVRIDNTLGNQITVTNCGQGVITNDSLAVFIDDVKLKISMNTIPENRDGVVNITDVPNTTQKNHVLQIKNGIGSDMQVYSSRPRKGTESNPGVSCADIFMSGFLPSGGVYWIAPAGTNFQVYCDMVADGGGWTLIASAIGGKPPVSNWEATTGINMNNAFDINATFRLSDASINAMRNAGATKLRVNKSLGVTVYAWASNTWDSGISNIPSSNACTDVSMTQNCYTPYFDLNTGPYGVYIGWSDNRTALIAGHNACSGRPGITNNLCDVWNWNTQANWIKYWFK